MSILEEAIEKYIEEEFDFNKGSLHFNCEKLEISLLKDTACQGVFHIFSEGGVEMQGYLYTADLRMSCAQLEFAGQEAEIRYQFDSAGMEEGETCRGSFHIVSNKGEYYLPYLVKIEPPDVQSSMGNVRNLFHFANLAKSNWREAVQLFYGGNFPQILTNPNDRQYFSHYKGLVKDYGNEQNVEEFLIEIHKKRQIEFTLETKPITLENPVGMVEEKICISKNGWGHLALHVRAEGSFLHVEKEYLSDYDFLGNQCCLGFYINSNKLRGGSHYGKIHFTHAYGQFSVPVTVINSHNQGKIGYLLREQELNRELVNSYISFRTRKKNTSSWIKENQGTVDKLVRLDQDNPAYRLYQAQLLITKERYHEAKWMLDHVKDMLEGLDTAPEVSCYYLYLTTLYHRDEKYVNEKTAQVEEFYRKYPNNWRIAWLLLYLREEYGRNPSAKWNLLEEQFERNANSPVLYVEAAYLVNMDSSLLQKLEGFELQVVNYAVKKELLGKEAIPQILYLVGHVRSYSDMLFTILKYCYRLTGEDGTLKRICELLIKGGRTEEGCFEWYAAGVEKQLRITRLYEHYMMSIPLEYEGELPRLVMMYFAYESQLGYERNAFLYANVWKHGEQFPEMVRSYQKQMELFVKEQLRKGHINRDLAYLYDALLPQDTIKETTAALLAPLLFVKQLVVEEDRMKQVVVIHEKLKGEVRYPVINGKAMVAIYSGFHKIFLQDAHGNRYEEEGSPAGFLDPKRYLGLLEGLELPILGCDIYICEGSSEFAVVTENNAYHFEKLIRAEQVREDYKREIRVSLLHYYFDNDCIRELDAYLEDMVPEGMTGRERAEFIQYMVIRGIYNKALAWIREFGAEGVQSKTLVRLCSRILYRTEYKEDEFLIKLCHTSFCLGRYDESILKYLVSHYKGDTRELRDIWKAAGNFEVDTYDICERILVQMLYTGCFISEGITIFQSYVKAGAKSKVQLAYLTHCAYEYFVENVIMPDALFVYLERTLKEDGKAGVVCRLAYLKYYAEHKNRITDSMEKGIREMLWEMLEQRICFPFFLEYVNYIPRLEIMEDQTFLEYRTKEDSRVMIHYRLEQDRNGNAEDYRGEELRKLYDKIHVKAFALFYGERIQYYITEQCGEREELTSSGILGNNDESPSGKDSRFSMLNDLSIANALKDYDTLGELTEDFGKKEFITKRLFRLL